MMPAQLPPTRIVVLATALLLLVLPACSSTRLVGNALVITEPTRGPNDLTLTVTVGSNSDVDGMQVRTVGDDTVITRLEDSAARRFILSGLTGYSGKLYLRAVDLVVGGTSVWIDAHSFKAHGPDGSVDIRLQDPDGEDLFDGRDLIYRGGRLTPIGNADGER